MEAKLGGGVVAAHVLLADLAGAQVSDVPDDVAVAVLRDRGAEMRADPGNDQLAVGRAVALDRQAFDQDEAPAVVDLGGNAAKRLAEFPEREIAGLHRD